MHIADPRNAAPANAEGKEILLFSVGVEVIGIQKAERRPFLRLVPEIIQKLKVSHNSISPSSMYDVKMFHNPEETRVNTRHVGEHVGNLTNVVNQDADFVFLCKLVKEDVEKWAAGDMQSPLHLGFVCRSGTHRSVACARLFAEILCRLGLKASCRHLNTGRWRAAGKCSQCASCDLALPAKLPLFERARRIYCSV